MKDATAAAAKFAASPAADDTALARAALGRVDFFRSERPEDARITRLGGLTNIVFKVDCNGDSYVLRLPGQGTEDYIDRELEAIAAREAARVGASPEVIVADAVTGIMVTQFMKAATMSAGRFKSSPGAPSRAGALLRKLHSSDAKFKFRFELFGMIDEYLRVLDGEPMTFPDGFAQTRQAAEHVRRALDAHRLPLTACHCDPLPENFLDDGNRMWLVDWEFSGMNDPLWDLGDVCVEAGFDAAQQAELIAAYFDAPPSPVQSGRIELYKAMCDYLWTLWGLVQHASHNPADDFWAYASRRLIRCQAAMGKPAFAAHMNAVTRG